MQLLQGVAGLEVRSRTFPEGAERGVFASEAIAAGSTLLREAPLRAASKAALIALLGSSDAAADYGPLLGSSAAEKVRRNAFVLGGGGAAREDGALLFRDLSLVNHSCYPNASVRLSSDGDEALLVAACDLEPGDEILLCYADDAIFAEGERRREVIRSRFGFVCGCARCRGDVTEEDADSWAGIEEAARAAAEGKPKRKAVEPELAAKVARAGRALARMRPYLVEAERFAFDSAYFSGRDSDS